MPEREPTTDPSLETPSTTWEAHLASCPTCTAAAANIVRAHHQDAPSGSVENTSSIPDDPVRFSRREMDPPLTTAEIGELRQVLRIQSSPVKIAALYGAKAGLWEEGRWSGTCPCCQGPEGSFRAGEDGVWNCSFCNEGGDVVDLVAKVEGWTADQAALQLAQQQDLIAEWQAPLARNEWMQRIYERKAAQQQWQAPNPKWDPPHRTSN